MSSYAHTADGRYFTPRYFAEAEQNAAPVADTGIWRAIATGMALALIGLSLTGVAVEAGHSSVSHPQTVVQTESATHQMPVP